jgi:CheY-like chemotaxis protein
MDMLHKRTILLVDDDELNLMILIKNAKAAGYTVKPFEDSLQAWDYLQAHPAEIDIAVLDKMMPNLDGLEILRRMKQSNELKHIPVIMQTGDVSSSKMCEGLLLGAYYYLTKPFSPEVFNAILHSAEKECLMRDELVSHVTKSYGKIGLILQEGEFELRTHAEARLLAAALSQCLPRPDSIARGLMELMNNAIEHGMYEIGYEAKRECLLSGHWWQELELRAQNPLYANRRVQVHVEKMFNMMHVQIRDDGKGFDYEQHLKSPPAGDLLSRISGRGVLTAFGLMDEVKYIGSGNEVICNIPLSTSDSVLNQLDRREFGSTLGQ